MSTKKKFRMVCTECGSEDVMADAYAAWDIDSQTWELVTTFDKGSVCDSCGGECHIRPKEIKDEKDQ